MFEEYDCTAKTMHGLFSLYYILTCTKCILKFATLPIFFHTGYILFCRLYIRRYFLNIFVIFIWKSISIWKDMPHFHFLCNPSLNVYMYIFFAFTNSTVVISYEITTYKLWHFNFRYLKITPLNSSKNIFFKCFLFSCIIFLLISFFHMYMVYSLFFRFHDFCKSFTCFCWLQILKDNFWHSNCLSSGALSRVGINERLPLEIHVCMVHRYV